MNQILDQFAKQPLSVKLVVLAVMVLALGGMNYQMAYQPKVAQLKMLQKKSADLSVKLAEHQSIAADYTKFQEEVNILNEQLKQAVALLPNEANIHAILRQLSITAKKVNIDLLSFRPGNENRRGFYSEIGMELKLSGTYHDIARYIDQIGKLSRIINIRNLVFSNARAAKNTIMLDVDCQAITFVFRGG